MKAVKIIWTEQAKLSLKQVYDFYKKKSQKDADNVKYDLLKAPKYFFKTVSSRHYQPELRNYRRIVIRNFKILYKASDSVVKVMDIVNTRKSPEILKKK